MEYYDLGRHSRQVTTSSPEAQAWFDRGLVWTYGFNHQEAVYCFEQALRHDPDCAMAHWGVGYALGPNYNKPWEAFDEADLRSTVERALSISASALASARRYGSGSSRNSTSPSATTAWSRTRTSVMRPTTSLAICAMSALTNAFSVEA